MALKEQLRNELYQLDGAFNIPAVIALHEGPETLVCELVGLDAIGCAFKELEIVSPALAKDSLEQLRKRAEKLTAAVTYLLEPLGLVEIDGDAAVVQLRSKPPQKEGRERTYYELLVRRDGISLRRWRSAAGAPRTAIPAEVTREVLLRLADDMQQAAK